MSHHGRKRVLPTGGVVRSVKEGYCLLERGGVAGDQNKESPAMCDVRERKRVSAAVASHQENQSAITGHGSSPAASMIAADSSDGTVPELSQESVSIFVPIASPYWYSPQ